MKKRTRPKVGDLAELRVDYPALYEFNGNSFNDVGLELLGTSYEPDFPHVRDNKYPKGTKMKLVHLTSTFGRLAVRVFEMPDGQFTVSYNNARDYKWLT